MILDLHNYDIYTKVFALAKPCKITIKPMGRHAAFKPDTTYTVHLYGLLGGAKYFLDPPQNISSHKVKPDENGNLVFENIFEKEQEYYVRVFDDTVEQCSNFNKLLQLSVYAVEDDLVGRYPLTGDLHMHSTGSDGKEAAEIVAANYRKLGYDFLAITDHYRYSSSIETINMYKGINTDYLIVPGEELHMPGNYVHVVNFGGDYSVAALVERHEGYMEHFDDTEKLKALGISQPKQLTKDEYYTQVNEIIASENIPEGVEAFPYASTKWACNEVRKANGLSIYCHPYWLSDLYNVPESLHDYITSKQPFDAYEVLGGMVKFSENGLQASHYYEDKIKGHNYPIVGSTDSHGSVHNPEGRAAKTIVFAHKNEAKEIIDSVKKFYTVAVDTISKEARFVGDYRLVKYASFLYEHYFPLHDELCFEEGRLMREYCCDSENAKERLNNIGRQITELHKKYFF